ncbi:MAG TPA: hypothetical protein VGR62_16870 [Candidatus Binatia bacterium]|jgi:hypothetical protein|nr:hypothetical protein [Candidatus Binatia bacterium]
MPAFPTITSRTQALQFQETAYMTIQQPARYRDTFQRMKAALGERDRTLTGWDEIEEFLWKSGVRNREGGRVDEQTVRRWRRDLNFPLMKGRGALPGRHRATAPFTTTFAVVSWLVSLPYSGGFRFPRIERVSTKRHSPKRSFV